MIDIKQTNPKCKILLENEFLQVEILPQDGGRIVSLVDKKNNCPLIWTNVRTENVHRYYNCDYDDLSNGGLEEAFPTVQPCVVDGLHYPFFGEIWNLEWSIKEYDDEHITLFCFSPVCAAKVIKNFFLSSESKTLVVEYSIENLSFKEFPYIFGFHPSFVLYKGTKLEVPDGNYDMYISPGQEEGSILSFKYPLFQGEDISIAKDEASYVYYNFLSFPTNKGEYSVIHPFNNSGVRVNFDSNFFKCLSLWPLYGGCRGFYCLMTEAFTAWPAKLDEAIEKNHAYWIPAKEKITTSVSYSLIN